MQTETPVREDSTLTAVRRRSQGFLGYLLWVCVVLCLLWVADIVASLLGRWVTLLKGARSAAGLAPPAAGPDYLVLGGVAALSLAVIIALAVAYSVYRAAWERRLRLTWGPSFRSGHARIRPLRALADEPELRRRTLYVQKVAACPAWLGRRIEPPDDNGDSYKNAATAMLRSVETDIARRAVTAGLVIGLNRSPLIDALSIAASAFELQLHVLTLLGKRPSASTWIEMLKRTSGSIFLNSYVNREDALYLNLAIRKAALGLDLGLEMAADTVQHASVAMADIDWDEVLHGMKVPGLSAVMSVAATSMTVGAIGLKQIGSFIEATANNMVQGVLAGGILYYHGMALAADCLALDENHRQSPEMTRTIGQAMNVACAPAGRLLRDQVRRMRTFLRERQRMVYGAAADAARNGVDKLRTASSSRWASVKEATGLFRERPESPSD
jgi:hypothetical protein